MPPVKLPVNLLTSLLTRSLDVGRMVDIVAEKERIIPRWDTDSSRKWLAAALREKLLEGRLSTTLKAIKAADAGDVICDATLRLVYAEIPDKVLLEEQAAAYLHIRAYGKRAVLSDLHKRQGHRSHADCMLNIQIST